MSRSASSTSGSGPRVLAGVVRADARGREQRRHAIGVGQRRVGAEREQEAHQIEVRRLGREQEGVAPM